MNQKQPNQPTTCHACNQKVIIIPQDIDDHPEPENIIEYTQCQECID